MKKIAIALALLLQGCMCIDLHSSSYKVPAGMYAGTRACASVLAIPFSDMKGTGAAWARAYATVMFPVFLVDFPLEIVADTCTFPYDLYVWLDGVD